MNSFQSLLESYNALRKRTYKIEYLNLFLSESSEDSDAVTNALKDTGMLGKANVDRDIYNQIVTQFRMISHEKNSPDNAAFITAFGGPQPYVKGGYPGPGLAVWLNKDGSNFNFRGSSSDNTASLPVLLKSQIIAYLNFIQYVNPKTNKPAVEGDVDRDAAAGRLTDADGNPLDPEALARAQEVAANNDIIAGLAGELQQAEMFPNAGVASVNALLAPTRVYPPGHPFEKLYTIVGKLMAIFYKIGIPNPERIHEAIIELQKDTIDMLNWLKDNQQALDEALEKGGCIPEDDTIKKLRNRFYFANTNGSTFALGYGNFQGEDTSPSKMSGMVEGITDEELENFPNKDVRGSGVKQIKEHQGNQSGTASLSNSLGGVPNHAQKSTNPLAQMLSKYEGVKICNKDGSNSTENLFKKDHIESAGNLVSAISENSAVLASHLLHARNLEDKAKKLREAGDKAGAKALKAQAEELNAKLAEVVNYLIEACKKYKEGVKELSKHVKAIEEETGGPLPFKTMAYQSVEDDIEGKVGNHFGENKKCKEVTLEILQRELEDNPIHNAVREMHEDPNNDFKGEVTITDTHPDGRPVNKIVGNQAPGDGTYDVPYHTRCTPDTLLQCDSPEDMEYMLMKLGVKKGSLDWKLAMAPQGIKDNMKYIFPISDKYYRKVGPTNQGVSDMSVLEKEDFVDRALLENLEGVGDIGEREALSEAGKNSIKTYNKDAREALLQIDDPDLLKGVENPKGKEVNAQAEVEQNTLREDLKSTFKDVKINSKSYDEAESILNELKDLEKLKDSGDPTYASKAKVLSYRIAEFKQQRRIDRLAKFDSPTPKQKKELNELKAGREIRKAIALTGTGPGAIVVKNSDARGTHLVTHSQVRNAAAAKSLSYLRDDENFRKETESDKQTNAGDRIKTNRDNGNQSKKMSATIHAVKILTNNDSTSNYIQKA